MVSSSRAAARTTCLLAFTLLLSAALPPPASAVATVTQAETLPTTRAFTSAVWTGSEAFVFGGGYGARLCQPACALSSDPRLTEIVRHVPGDNASVAVMGGKLPTGRYGTAAVWDGQRAYIIGGFDGRDVSEVVAYDPAADLLLPTPARLPTGAVWASAAMGANGDAYVFGGMTCPANAPGTLSTSTSCVWSSSILRLNLTTMTVLPANAKLPTGRAQTSAASEGRYIYVFGGFTSGNSRTDEILRYDTVTDTLVKMNAKLPTARYATSAAWDGQYAYVFGGDFASGQVVRYDPAADAVTVLPDTIPRSGTSAVWTGTDAYVFGGRFSCSGDSLTMCNTITRFHPTRPPPPLNLGGRVLDASSTLIHWNAPVRDEGIVAYRVYAGDGASSLGLLAELPASARDYTETGIAVPTARHYAVTDVTATGESPRSNQLRFTIADAPRELKNNVLNTRSMYVNWRQPLNVALDEIVEYRLFKGETPASMTLLATLAPTPFYWQQYYDTGFTADNQTFYYAVTTVTSAGEGAYAGPVPFRSAGVAGAPDAGVSFDGTANTVSWAQPDDKGGFSGGSLNWGLVEYRVYRGFESGNETLVGVVSARYTSAGQDTWSFRDSGCGLARACWYRVSTVNWVGEGAMGPEVTALGAATPLQSKPKPAKDGWEQDTEASRNETVATPPVNVSPVEVYGRRDPDNASKYHLVAGTYGQPIVDTKLAFPEQPNVTVPPTTVPRVVNASAGDLPPADSGDVAGYRVKGDPNAENREYWLNVTRNGQPYLPTIVLEFPQQPTPTLPGFTVPKVNATAGDLPGFYVGPVVIQPVARYASVTVYERHDPNGDPTDPTWWTTDSSESIVGVEANVNGDRRYVTLPYGGQVLP